MQGCILCIGGFFVATQAQIDALEAAALANALAGISSASVDGRSSQAIDPIKQLDALDRLKSTAVVAANPAAIFGARFQARFRGPGQ